MISENIKYYRGKLGISQEKLAHLSGVTYSNITKLEAGYIQDPRVKTLQKIADVLGVTVNDLLKE